MLIHSKEIIEKHVKTHTEHSDWDAAAVNTLESFLDFDGRINCDFSKRDKWPNIDGFFEFVPNPDLNRRPTQTFFVQIKGTHKYTEKDGIVKYSLDSLAFPAFIATNVTLDPGILFVVLDPDRKGEKRVFWKYMSVSFINSIDFNKDSATISFTEDEEIFDTNESVDSFCKKLEVIVSRHSFINKLSEKELNESKIEKIIKVCDERITTSIDLLDNPIYTRDDISHIILPRLYDLCRAALFLNSLKLGTSHTNLQLAWEQAMLKIETKYLATFLKGLKYIENEEPDDGQAERLMLKYYNFMWQIRDFVKKEYNISLLHNLEKFPLNTDKLDDEYHEMVAKSFATADLSYHSLNTSLFYIQKKTPFYVGTERYYEITLQLAGIYASKYNRITAYTKENISTDYSIKIGYVDSAINLWGIDSKIKIITNWKVSIDPTCLNKLAKILRMQSRMNSQYGEYSRLMDFLTETGINFVDLIDMNELDFTSIINHVFNSSNTEILKNILIKLKSEYSKASQKVGRNTLRYILLNLREETLESVMPSIYKKCMPRTELYLNSSCIPFEINPFIANLAGSKTSEGNLKKVANAIGYEKIREIRPYLTLKRSVKKTGEIYFDSEEIADSKDVDEYNARLDDWERKQGYSINIENGFASIESYERSTIAILNKLLEFSQIGNKGQKELNQKFLKENMGSSKNIDETKKLAIRDAFVNSKVLLIYGAAGTGKTTLINYISNLMVNSKKLFLTKTHSAKQNLQRRIENPGTNSEFVSFDSFTKKLTLTDYDLIFVDECSILDNRAMENFFTKVGSDTLLVFAGDVHQIESIDFGNWFYYAKDIITQKGANIELLDTWRTDNDNLLSLWNEVRNKDEIITEKLVIDGPFSEDIGENIFSPPEGDEVVLCLNYDGKFGLNNINNYFQDSNPNKAVAWQEWTYKEGDRILFNNSSRFTLLYNNLKGRIVKIEKYDTHITFTVDVSTLLTENNCKKEDIEFVDIIGEYTRIKFTVYAYDEQYDDEISRMKSVIPFQLAYAISIHKAQGLEYDSVKVIIPKSNTEKITHGIFYTAITRAKNKLKIYWSSETMNDIVKSFSSEHSGFKSLEIIKQKLDANQ